MPSRWSATAVMAVSCAALLIGQRVQGPELFGLLAQAVGGSEREARRALDVLAANWHAGFPAMILELAELNRFPAKPGPNAAPESGDASRPQPVRNPRSS